MAKISENGKYVTLDGVRVSYRKSDNTIHITSTDEDFEAGFHLTLNEGSSAERGLRQILIDNGIVEEETLKDKLPEFVAAPTDRGVWDKIRLGVTSDGTLVSWHVALSPHGLIAGAVEPIVELIKNHCVRHETKWDVYVVNTQNHVAPNTKHHAVNLRGATKMLYDLVDEMGQRFAYMAKLEVNHFDKLPVNTGAKNIMVLLEDYNSLFSTTQNARTQDETDFIELLHRLVRLGRAAGIHIVINATRPDVRFLPGELRNNLDLRIVMGRMDSTPSSILLESGEAVRTRPDVNGRGVIRMNDEILPFQAFTR